MTALPGWVEAARGQWAWRSQARPPFAVESGPGQESVWDYPPPFAGAEAPATCVAFYLGALDCRVGDGAVRPQPGGFYGGWITPELVGPFKGERGSQDW